MKEVLLSGFEPESKPRKGFMIGRYTTGAWFYSVAPRGFEPLSLAPKASMIDHYTTGLTIIFSVMGPGLELSYYNFFTFVKPYITQTSLPLMRCVRW
jgi:hypothetical protein